MSSIWKEGVCGFHRVKLAGESDMIPISGHHARIKITVQPIAGDEVRLLMYSQTSRKQTPLGLSIAVRLREVSAYERLKNINTIRGRSLKSCLLIHV